MVSRVWRYEESLDTVNHRGGMCPTLEPLLRRARTPPDEVRRFVQANIFVSGVPGSEPPRLGRRPTHIRR